MINAVLIYPGAFLTFIWGVAHLMPTRSVVSRFGDISPDNRRIIATEWIIEGVSLIFIGLLAAAVTWVDSSTTVSRMVYWICIIQLNTLSIISLFTGFKVNFLPFKLCPLIFTVSSLLIALGLLL